MIIFFYVVCGNTMFTVASAAIHLQQQECAAVRCPPQAQNQKSMKIV